MIARAALAVLVIVATRPAFADPAPDAAQLSRDGQAAFDQAHYDDALAAWQRSYDLSHAPALLYNLAQAYRMRAQPGDCARARADYQSFVQLDESAPERPTAEGYIAQLATCATVAPTPIESAHEQALSNRKIAAAALGAGGIVLLATGVYFGHHASTLGNEVTSDCARPGGCDWGMESSKDAAGHRDTTLGWTFDALGVVALASGAALYWFGVHDAELQVAPVATRSHETGAVLSWSHAW